MQELQELQKNAPTVDIIQLDVTDDASIKKAFEHVSKTVGSDGLNLLINNSGILENVSPTLLHRQLRLAISREALRSTTPTEPPTSATSTSMLHP